MIQYSLVLLVYNYLNAFLAILDFSDLSHQKNNFLKIIFHMQLHLTVVAAIVFCTQKLTVFVLKVKKIRLNNSQLC